MAGPKGWTDREVKHRDKVAEALMRRGFDDRQAFAIATNQMINTRKKKGVR